MREMSGDERGLPGARRPYRLRFVRLRWLAGLIRAARPFRWLRPLPPFRPPRRARAAWPARAWRLRAALPWWWPLAGCLALGLAAGGAHALAGQQAYAASGQVLVSAARGGDPALAVGFAQAYGRVATDGAVLTTAHADAGVPVAELRDRVRAATSPDAPMIEITGTAPSAAEAAVAANAVAGALIAHGNDATAETGARLSLFAEASPHARPVTPDPLVSLASGGCAGAVIGCLTLLTRARRRPAPRESSPVPSQTTALAPAIVHHAPR